MAFARQLKSLSTATLLIAVMSSSQISQAEIISTFIHVRTGKEIQTNITNHTGGPIDVTGNGPFGNIAVGYHDHGRLTIFNGSIFDTYKASFGVFPDIRGLAIVKNSNSQWNINGDIQMDKSGSGELQILDHGTVTAHQLKFNETARVILDNGNLKLRYLDPNYYPQISGTGIISVNSGIFDHDFVLNSSAAFSDSFAFNPHENLDVTLNVDLSENVTTFGVGYNGTGSLTINNGMSLEAEYTFFGENQGSNGTLNVTGAESSYTAVQITIANRGDGTLNVTDGASVLSLSDLTIASEAGSKSVVNVSGNGTILQSNGTRLYVGKFGDAKLNIADGATVKSGGSLLLVGTIIGGSAEVNINGGGSNLSSKISMHFGNALVNVKNKGKIHSPYDATIAAFENERAIINLSDEGTLFEVGRDLEIFNGELNISNGAAAVTKNLEISDQGVVNLDNGSISFESSIGSSISRIMGVGTVNTRSSVVDAAVVIGSPDDLVQTTQLNSLPGQDLTVNVDFSHEGGVLGAGNQSIGTLTIENGMQINSDTGQIGLEKNALGVVVVKDENTFWDINNTLLVGRHGTGILQISAGAKVNSSETRIGTEATGNGTITVTGNGSNLNTIGSTHNSISTIGDYGTGALNISSGASVNSNNITLGLREGSTGSVIVKGQNSKWHLQQSLYVGDYGDGSLVVNDGGTVNARSIILGRRSRGNNSFLLSGENSVVNTNQIIFIKFDSAIIQDNATLNTTSLQFYGNPDGVLLLNNATINTDFFDPEHQSRIVGNGTINASGTMFDQDITLDDHTNLIKSWDIDIRENDQLLLNIDFSKKSEKLGIGYKGQGLLTIENGVNIETGDGYIGYEQGSAGRVAITGQNSIWLLTEVPFKQGGRLFVGKNGSGELIISQGGMAKMDEIIIAEEAGSAGSVTLDGKNSRLESGSIIIGDNGDAVFNVQNGASVTLGNVTIALETSSTSNIKIDGNDTILNAQGLYIGQRGTATLMVSDGARVNTTALNLGAGDTSVGTAIVKDQGTYLDVDGSIILGKRGNGSIEIINGAIVRARGIEINSGTLDTIVNVSGQGSTLTLYGDEHFTSGTLEAEHGSRILIGIEDGGTIHSRKAYIGGAQESVTIKGEGSVWNNDELFVLGTRYATTLNIHDGAMLNTGSMIIASREYSGDNLKPHSVTNVVGIGSKIIVNERIVVGSVANGFLNISQSGKVVTKDLVMGLDSHSRVSRIIVEDENSILDVQGTLTIGKDGGGLITIRNNGLVKAQSLKIGNRGVGVLLDNGTFQINNIGIDQINKITGEGNLNTNGFIVDGEVVYDQSSDLNQQWFMDTENQTFTVNSDLTMLSDLLGSGFQGYGMLSLRNGVSVSSLQGILGYGADANGAVYLEDVGTSWTIEDTLIMGVEGKALIVIGAGAELHTGNTQIDQLNVVGGRRKAVPAAVSLNEGRAYIKLDGRGTLWDNRGDVTLGTEAGLNLVMSDGAILKVGQDLNLNEFVSITFGLDDPQTFIDIEGDLNLAGTAGFDINELDLLQNQEFILMDVNGMVTGTFSNMYQDKIVATVNGLDLYFTYLGGDGNDIAVYSIPEPSALFTLLVLMPLALKRRKI